MNLHSEKNEESKLRNSKKNLWNPFLVLNFQEASQPAASQVTLAMLSGAGQSAHRGVCECSACQPGVCCFIANDRYG